MTATVVDILAEHVDLSEIRIRELPNFIMVFGGPLGNPMGSARQLFLNWVDINRRDLSEWMRRPEEYQDWNSHDGYQNLIDFERDAVCLTRAVILFSESPGSHAELGAFCMDPILSERLLVVISNEHYTAGSFIAKGPVKKIEDIESDSICTVSSIAPPDIQYEMSAIIDALDAKLASMPKSMLLDLRRQRDQFLIIADFVELFGALTISEILDLCKQVGIATTVPHIKSMYRQLERFGLVVSTRKYSQIYYVPAPERFSFLDYKSKKDGSRFDRMRFKTSATMPWLKSDKKRHDAYLHIHGAAA